MVDPVVEFIGQQLHSVSNIDAGMMPKRSKSRSSFKWWPYQHHKSSKAFNTDSHEDRLIGAIDKKRRYSHKSRQNEVEDLLSKGYRKKEIAKMIGIHPNTVTADTKKIRLRLIWERTKKA